MDAPEVTDGQFCEVQPGITLHYASSGAPGRPLMLFVHGFPEFWYAWRDVLPRFADAFHAVAPDLRGYNRSSKPPEVRDYRPALVIADLAALIRRLGHGKAVVVAHDWGGALAWGLAATHPELVERLVILNAPHAIPFARALVRDPEQRAASAYMNFLRDPDSEAQLAADDFARLDGFLAETGDADGLAWFSGETRAAYHRAWSEPGALRGSVNYYRASPLYPPEGDDPGAGKLALREEDFVVSVPTLVLWGERDRALRPVLLEGLERLVPDLRIERLPQASHWLVHEQPDAVVAAIRRFTGLPA